MTDNKSAEKSGPPRLALLAWSAAGALAGPGFLAWWLGTVFDVSPA